MKVDVIDTYAEFERVRANWNSVYTADPDANVFLSWDWLSKWLPEDNDHWLILAARSSQAKEYVGFFPMRFNTRLAQSGEPVSEIAVAGGNFADYAGFIVRPTSADATIDAFARAIKSLNWTTAKLNHMRISEEYLARFIRAFPRSRFDVLTNYPMGNAKGADNCICPFISLPSTWDQYLACLGSNMRQKLRRLLRNVENNPALRITHANAGNIETSIEALIAFWTKKWSDLKGNRLEAMQRVIRAKIHHYSEIGVLYCPVLWRGESPVGIHANLIDSEKRVMHFFVGARDENSADLQPGFTLHAHSIRHSMEMGITRYDFMRGNEDYKYSFGSTDRRISNTIIHRRADANESKGFDARSIPHALRLIKQQRSAGSPVRAEAGYRKILSVGPNCLPAMLGLAEAKATQGDIMAAEVLLRDLVTQQRDSQAAWVALGQCLAAKKSWPEAEACYCRALELNPRFAPAHYHLGVMYEAKGSAAQAQRSYKAAIELDPDFRDVKQRLIGCVLKSGGHDGQGGRSTEGGYVLGRYSVGSSSLKS